MSSRRIVLRAAADEDLTSAVDHYLSEAGEHVALAFIDAFGKAMERLSRHPASGSLHYLHILEIAGLRCLALARYPYLVFYLAGDENIDVWRILHAQSDIPTWMNDGDDRSYS